MNKWNIGLLASVAAFIITQGIAIFTFSKNLQATKTIEMINLAKDLSQEFYKEEEVNFKNIRMAIESCEPLYDGYEKGGKFNRDEINRYLGFFDDLGFYVKRGALDLSMIDQFFAPYIIEVFETTEIRQYIKEFRENFKQRDAFRNFEELARSLENDNSRKELVETFRISCAKSVKPR